MRNRGLLRHLSRAQVIDKVKNRDAKSGREEKPLTPEQPNPSATRGLAVSGDVRTRANTRQLSGHFPVDIVQAWRVLAAEQDMESQELLAMGINMVFEHFGRPVRVLVISGRRKKTRS